MKHYLLIGLVFLMMGCETIEANSVSVGNTQVVAKTPIDKVKPVPTVPKKEPSAKRNIQVIKSAKPVLCAPAKTVFKHLISIGEELIATWKDETYGYDAMLFVNMKTGSSSVIEAPGLNEGQFKGLVCFISTGVQTTVKTPPTSVGINATFISKKALTF